MCAGADVVVVDASDAAAGEGGGRSGADVDTADAVVGSVTVLRCIGHEHTLSEKQSRRQGAWRRASPEGRQRGPLGRVCEAGAPLRGGGGHDACGCRGPGTHSNEREGAVRVDCDANGVTKLCAGADVIVLEASNAAASEGGRRPGADVDTAD